MSKKLRSRKMSRRRNTLRRKGSLKKKSKMMKGGALSQFILKLTFKDPERSDALTIMASGYQSDKLGTHYQAELGARKLVRASSWSNLNKDWVLAEKKEGKELFPNPYYHTYSANDFEATASKPLPPGGFPQIIKKIFNLKDKLNNYFEYNY